MRVGDTQKRKMLALLIVLSGKVVNKNQIDALAEEVKKMGNVIFEYFEERAEKRNKEEIAKKMISRGYDSLEVVDITGLSIEQVKELRSAIRLETPSA